jgi:hypothetical protein
MIKGSYFECSEKFLDKHLFNVEKVNFFFFLKIDNLIFKIN